jgi:hypothetical protein
MTEKTNIKINSILFSRQDNFLPFKFNDVGGKKGKYLEND